MMNNNKKSEQRGKTKLNNLLWILHILSILIIVTIFIILSPKNTDENQLGNIARPQRAIGPETAPVIITEYADFGCITCKAWHQFGIREQIIDRYGDQVRFVWRDFPVTTTLSPKAAEAGFCAADQDHFWSYHEVLFENAPALEPENLKAYAEAIGLDTGKFNQCLDSRKFQQAVDKELANAKDMGLRGVPSFVVNEKRLIGPPSFEQLTATIDEILSSQE